MIFKRTFKGGSADAVMALFFCTLLAFMPGCGDDDDDSTPSGPTIPAAMEQIITGGGNDPTISPDGNWMAYRKPGVGIVKHSLTTHQETTLTEFGLEPDWSSTGDMILIRSGGLFTVDASTGDTAFLCDNSGWDDGAVWSPDGDEIAAEGSSGLVVISYPDGILSPVTCYDPDGTGCQGEGPSWSPDGQWIAFEDGLEILKVKRSGDTAETVVAGLNDVGSPVWSPDGQWIAFVMEDSMGYHIWVADQRGIDSGLWQVTAADTTCLGLSCNDFDPCWSPDSRTIYFSSNRDGSTGGIWRIGFEP